MNGAFNNDNRYEMYLEYLVELNFLSGNTETMNFEEIEALKIDTTEVAELLKEAASKVILEAPEPEVKKKRVLSEGDEEDEDGNLTRSDEILQLDDEFDDTKGEMPDGYVVSEYPTLDETAIVNGMDKEAELQKEEEEPDEWGF